MLGKICWVVLLLIVSACLSCKHTPTGEEKIVPVIDNLATLLARWGGAKSTDEVVAKMLAKGNDLEAEDYRALRKLLVKKDMVIVDAFRKPMTAKIASLDELLADYKRLSAGEKIREVIAVEIKNLGVKYMT